MDVEHCDGIGSRVHGKQQRALGVDKEVLIGIERAESERPIVSADSPGRRTAEEG